MTRPDSGRPRKDPADNMVLLPDIMGCDCTLAASGPDLLGKTINYQHAGINPYSRPYALGVIGLLLPFLRRTC